MSQPTPPQPEPELAPLAEKATAKKTVAKKAVAKKPAAKKPVAEQPVPEELPAKQPVAEPPPPNQSSVAADEHEMPPVMAHVKWFDATRGFGFLVSEEIDGDILIHFSVLREHGRRSLPEGAIVECVPARMQRGLQAKKVLSIDLDSAVTAPKPVSAADRANRDALADRAGEFEPVQVKWFNRSKGYGFLNREDDGQDVFVHMETVRNCGLRELMPGQLIEARIAESSKGLTAVELREA